MDHLAIRQWLAVLDTITYYELLGADPRATYDDLRAAFHRFAESFHPDGHRWRDPSEQAAIGAIYRRGTEAWRVLSDPPLRSRYDDAVATGDVRPEDIVVERESTRSLAPAPPAAGRLIDSVRAPGARPFVLRAEELLGKGDARQARIQLVMAMHIDRDNPALEALAARLEEEARAGKDDARGR
jgi:curved DNA-binding protein CbpA